MTAPAIAPTAPAPTPVAASAPVVETQAPATTIQTESGLDSLIGKISRRVTPEALTEVPLGAEAPEVPRGRTPDVDAPVNPEVAIPIAPAMVAEIAYDDPEGQVVLRARDPANGQFSDMDSTRVYELSIKDPTTGAKKVYEKDLKGLMRLAQDGLNVQRANDELKYYRENVGTWRKGHEGLAQEITTTKQEYEGKVVAAKQEMEGWQTLAISLLTEPPEWVDQRRQAYHAQFTPENELARAKQRIAELESGKQISTQRPAAQPPAQQPVAQPSVSPAVVQGFVQSVGAEIAKGQELVGEEAAAGYFARLTAKLLVNGQLPPERFAEVERQMKGPFHEWAKAESAKRIAAATAQMSAQTQAELAKARETQTRAQLAARNLGTATRPNAVTTGTQTPQRAKPTNVRDMVDSIARRQSSAQTGQLIGG